MKISIEIPERSIWSAVWLVLSGLFTYIQIPYLIASFERIFALKAENTGMKDIGLMWAPIITYGLLAVMFCLMVGIFKELKPYNKNGLISGIVCDFKLGLVLNFLIYVVFNIFTLFYFGPIIPFVISLTLSLPLIFVLAVISNFVGEFTKE